MKNVLILEDNPVTLEHLTKIIHDLDPKNVIYFFDNIKDAYQCVMEKTIDLFLIDIILDSRYPGDTSGLKFVENIRRIEYYSFTPIIFITSLEDVRAYTYENLHCYSFIEKPFDVDRVTQTIEKCLKFPGKGNDTKTLYFRKEGIIVAVEREDIGYVESINHILHIHTIQGGVLKIPYITLKKLIEDIDSCEFIQCSRNTIINKRFVQNVDIANRIIQLKDIFGKVGIGTMFKKHMAEYFK